MINISKNKTRYIIFLVIGIVTIIILFFVIGSSNDFTAKVDEDITSNNSINIYGKAKGESAKISINNIPVNVTNEQYTYNASLKMGINKFKVEYKAPDKSDISILQVKRLSPEAYEKYHVIGYKIGEKGPAGGIIFYDKGYIGDGWRYLEVAPYDQGNAQWGCMGNDLGVTASSIGSGKNNTKEIISKCPQYYTAAKICDNFILNGYNDWFLPSKDELKLIFSNLRLIKSVGYWSSTEETPSLAFHMTFTTGDQIYYGKDDNAISVLAIRSF